MSSVHLLMLPACAGATKTELVSPKAQKDPKLPYLQLRVSRECVNVDVFLLRAFRSQGVRATIDFDLI